MAAVQRRCPQGRGWRAMAAMLGSTQAQANSRRAESSAALGSTSLGFRWSSPGLLLRTLVTRHHG